MTTAADLLLAAFMGVCLMLGGSSRMVHCIRLVAFQGILLGLLVLAMQDWTKGVPGGEILLTAAINMGIKGVLLPLLLRRAMYKAGVRRELEPLVGYSWSLLVITAAGALALWLSRRPDIPGVNCLAVPAAAIARC